MNIDRILVDPTVMNAQPCVRGTRLTVKRVLHILAENPDREAIRKDYPPLDEEDIRQVLRYAAATLDEDHR